MLNIRLFTALWNYSRVHLCTTPETPRPTAKIANCSSNFFVKLLATDRWHNQVHKSQIKLHNHAPKTNWIASKSVQYRQTKNHRNLLRAPDCAIATKKCGHFWTDSDGLGAAEAGWWWFAEVILARRSALTEETLKPLTDAKQRVLRRFQAFHWGWLLQLQRLARICQVLRIKLVWIQKV